MTKTKTEMLTIMFVDMVNYTKTTNKLDREKFHYLHDVFDTHIYNVVKDYNGKLIKKLGDAFLVSFKSSTEAVLCGRALQIKFNEHNLLTQDEPIHIRVAIHAGEVVHRHGDIFGDVVNITSRIESIVKSGDVVFSELVYSSMNKNEVTYKYIGEFEFKGADHPINLFKIKTKQDFINEKKIIRRRKAKRLKKQIKSLIYRFVTIGVIGIIIYLMLTNQDLLLSLF